MLGAPPEMGVGAVKSQGQQGSETPRELGVCTPEAGKAPRPITTLLLRSGPLAPPLAARWSLGCRGQ